MTWGKFFVRTFIICLVLWLAAIYAYGNFVLADSIVPEQGTPIEDWLSSFYTAGGVSAVLGLLTSAIWFFLGKSYSGGAGIGVKFFLGWILAAALGAACAILLLAPAVDGKGAAFILIVLVAPLGYYLSSLFSCANAVKFIPPLANVIHK